MPVLGILASAGGGNYWLDSIIKASDQSVLLGVIGVGVTASDEILLPFYHNTAEGVAKISSSGTYQWAKALNLRSTGTVSFNDLTVDSSGNAYAVYSFYTPGKTGTIKFDSTGAIVWQKDQYEPSTATWLAHRAALDSSINIYSCGQRNGGGYATGLLYKINSSGTLQWAVSLRGFSDPAGAVYVSDVHYDVVVSSGGNSYVIGSHGNTSGSYGREGHVVKYNSSGAVQWQRNISDSGQTSANQNTNGLGIAIDSSENSYVLFSSTAGASAHLIKYNSSGALQWQRKFTDTLTVGTSWSVKTDTSGNVYVAGTNTDGVTILKYNTSGTLQWQRLITSSGATKPYNPSIVINSQQNLIVAATNDTSYTGSILLTLPNNGSRTGVITIPSNGTVTYSVNTSITDASSSLTDASVSMTATTLSGTQATTTYTATTETLSVTKVSI